MRNTDGQRAKRDGSPKIICLSILCLALAGCGRTTEATSETLSVFGAHAAHVTDHSLVVTRDASGLSFSRLAELSSGAEERLRIAADASDGVELLLGNGTHLRVHEEGASGTAEITEGALRHPRSGGTSYWTLGATSGFEEWLAVDRAEGDRPIARWQVEEHSFRAVPEREGVHVVDASGRAVAYVEAPLALRTNGDEVETRLAIEGDALALYVDGGGAAVLADPSWVATGVINVGRAGYALGSGLEVTGGAAFLFGGYTGGGVSLASTERYDLATGVWTLVANMSTGREFHTTTLLNDGRILVTGGERNGNVGLATATAELYDPAANTWTALPSMSTPRYFHTATLLPSGRVLVAGGNDGSGALSSAELFDPATRTWSTAPSMPVARVQHTATLLASGRVLLAGGAASSAAVGPAALYDPVSSTWSPTGSLVTPRFGHAAVRLASGRVLVAGGYAGAFLASAEIFDPATASWSPTGSMSATREYLTLTTIASGRVVAAGGTTSTTTSELYDPAAGTWSSGGTSLVRTQHAAALLPSGEVLVAGGYGFANVMQAELFVPDPVCGDGRTQGAETCDDGNLIAGDCCSPTCAFEPASTICRDAAGACDVAETCTGSSAACPANAVAAVETICRASAGSCDSAEQCDGSSTACPDDVLVATGTLCRASVGACDAEETCDGSDAECPDDVAVTPGTACGDAPSEICDAQDVCVGAVGATASCEARVASEGTACGAARCVDGMATSAGTCNGTDTVCATLTLACAPFVCGGAACLAECATNDDCVPGFECVGTSCEPEAGNDASVADGGITLVDAGPRDAGAGDAATSDGGVTPPAASGGCGCSVPSTGGSTGLASGMLLALVMIVLRRRASRG